MKVKGLIILGWIVLIAGCNSGDPTNSDSAPDSLANPSDPELQIIDFGVEPDLSSSLQSRFENAIKKWPEQPEYAYWATVSSQKTEVFEARLNDGKLASIPTQFLPHYAAGILNPTEFKQILTSPPADWGNPDGTLFKLLLVSQAPADHFLPRRKSFLESNPIETDLADYFAVTFHDEATFRSRWEKAKQLFPDHPDFWPLAAIAVYPIQ